MNNVRIGSCSRFLSLSLTGAFLFAPIIARALAVTSTALAGTWDCRTVAMNDHGKPGAGINLKPHSLMFTFTTDGKWNMVGNGATQTTKSGNYHVRGTELILTNEDGSKYQDWQAQISDDANSLQVNDKKLFEMFNRVLASAQ